MTDPKKDNVVPDTTASAPVDLNSPVAKSFFEFVANSKANQSGNAAKGAVYTQQEADAGVQSVYQQLLGRNALGQDYKKALSVYLGQSQDTSATGRAQAVVNLIMQTPEYKARQENEYLDGLYTMFAQEAQRARA